ncbi:MAG: hypothetical protein IMZ64_11870 [Bacteroidetes bacterium]|nr:hypothetical protein [Bacteroidota bacterium]
MAQLQYRGFSQRAGRIKTVKSCDTERKTIEMLYLVFDEETEIEVIEPWNKERGVVVPTKVIDRAKLVDIYKITEP